MVWAQTRAGVIGADGGLPWHLPEDLRLFRALTLGSTVVMGRRTWESLPPRFRPLPGRRNVVLSATLDRVPEGAEVVRSVADARAAADGGWVIGGGAVYAAFLPVVQEVVVTEVDVPVPGDTWAPQLTGDWAVTARFPDDGWATSVTGLRYRVTARQRGPVAGHLGATAAVLAGWSAELPRPVDSGA